MERMDAVRVRREVRLGPLTRGLLARRRRWLRWAAAALAVLTMLSAAAQLRRAPAPRRGAVPAADPRRAANPAPGFDGVAAEVPPGTRVVNILVPAAAAFDGRLTPLSRVDLLAAFETGTDRVVQPVLTSGLVLAVAPRAAGAAGGALPAPASRFAPAPLAELSIAVPAGREREVAMAQAFGRLFIAVRPPAAATVDRRGRPAGPAGPLSLRPYLGLPALSPRPAGAAAEPSPHDPAAGVPVPISRVARAAHRRSAVTTPGRVAVEVIEGTARGVVEVAP